MAATEATVSGIFCCRMGYSWNWKLLVCCFSMVALVKSDTPVDNVKTQEMMHGRPHFADEDSPRPPTPPAVSTHYSSEGKKKIIPPY